MALLQGAQHSEDFLAKNPNHAVPVLDVTYADGSEQTLFESGAMMVWLADAYPKLGLAPAINDLAARGDYLQMMHFGGSWMDMMLWQIRLNETLLPKPIRSESTAQFNRDKIQNEVAPQLIARLEKHDYICGDTFSAADIMTGYNIGWARGYGLCQEEPLRQYRSRLSKREAFVKAYADASEFENKLSPQDSLLMYRNGPA